MKLFLPDLEDTLRLGRVFALSLPLEEPNQVLLLDGELGAGKTSFVRGLVRALPGGDEAEVSSPSFNLVNHYPTDPPVAHFDLYRLEGFGLDEDLAETLEAGEELVLVEWAGHLSASQRPRDCLRMRWEARDSGRQAVLSAEGPAAESWLQALRPEASHWEIPNKG